MKALRTMLRDRDTGRPLASLFVLLLLFQTFVGAFTCSVAMNAPGDATFVICHGDGAAVVSTNPVAPTPLRDPCPCGTCCSAGAAVLAELAPADDFGAAYALRDAVDLAFANVDNARNSPPVDGFPPDPRGPPTLSA